MTKCLSEKKRMKERGREGVRKVETEGKDEKAERDRREGKKKGQRKPP